MSVKKIYEMYLAAQEEAKKSDLKDVYVDQESRYVHPFQLYGNVYYVGDSWVCVHLIDTGDGLLLIDSGNCGATAMLIQAIWEAGFNPKDVKWIIHSHGHVDHVGGANFFRAMYGTKLYLGEPDAKMFRERPEYALMQESGNIHDLIFEPDYEIKDGDELTFGNTTMKFYMVPGHTEGCIAIFFDVYDGEEVKRAGYYGGFGFNTLQKDFLLEYGDPEFNMRKVYIDSLDKVINEKVDIYLGNHCVNNDTLGRRQKQIDNPDGPNPFIDPTLWKDYLSGKREEIIAFMNDPKNN